MWLKYPEINILLQVHRPHSVALNIAGEEAGARDGARVRARSRSRVLHGYGFENKKGDPCL